MEPDEQTLETVHLSGDELKKLELLRQENPERKLQDLIAELKKGRPAHALVVCSSMSLRPEDLKTLKERFYSPGVD